MDYQYAICLKSLQAGFHIDELNLIEINQKASTTIM